MQRWFSAFRHMKIRNKLTIFTALIILAAFLFTFIVQQYAFSIYDGQLYDKSSKVLNMSSSAIETELKRIEQASYNMIADAQIQKLLKAVKASTSEYDRHLLKEDIVGRLVSYAGTDSSIYSIQLIDTYDVKHEAGAVYPIGMNKMARIRDITEASKGGNSWIYPDLEDPALISAREVRSFSNLNLDLQYLGLLIIRVNIDKIVRKYAGEGEDLIMIAGDEVIYPEHPLFEPSRYTGLIRSENGYFKHDFDGKTYFVSHIRSANTGWTYLNITPFNQVFKQVIFIKELVILVFVFLFVVVVLLGIRFSRSLTRPIEDLIGRMKLAERGNFAEANLLPEGDQPVAMDEIGLLHRTFRLMIERIQALITENYSNRLLLKETEFRALQAQINPHFLYNTLESINWLAKVNRQSQISQMVEALGFLLRNSINLKQPILTLAEEIDIVNSYVVIQKYRFEERLDFTLDVPDRYLQRRIPKLTLQPLLENAVQYALEPSIGTCKISIRACEADEGDDWLVAIKDDGPGMAPDTLTRLRSGELAAKGRGIGLGNIDERIKLAFGERYGIRIDSEPGRGARVLILLPGETEGT
ncbi:sensor histidine kinase [Cohnella nanjingensis]|uniref:histidine kinase n=1 Tax=Cohnella nanjingensis TaxID=1387779 RepID=A0A7X0RML4_9BACL|nr:histidine kinase [Cohnella nanjingensis]MBB6670146.1 sensor histidine kinase [Cohnella nanjingensis]